MDRVNGADWFDIGGGKRGFRGQNAGLGIPGTEVTDDFLNDVQENILAVIEGEGLVANSGEWTLLWDAIRRLARRSNYYVGAGTANAITFTPAPALPSYAGDGQVFFVKPVASNTAAVTVNANGLGAVALTDMDGAALTGGEIVSGEVVALILLGGTFKLLSPGNATSARRGLVKTGQLAHGQCRLTYVSATSLKLVPCDGNNIMVAGQQLQIPAAGISVANTSVRVNGVANQNLANDAEYYVAIGTNGVLEFWTKATGRSTDTTAGNVGVEIITGHADKTLVGMIKTSVSGQFLNATNLRWVISWFNRRNISAVGPSTAGATTTSNGGVFAELLGGARTYFLTWADEVVAMRVSGQAHNSVAGNSSAAAIGLDGSVAPQGGNSGGSYSAVAGQAAFTGGFHDAVLSEGAHYITPIGSVANTGTGTFTVATAALVRG